MAMDQRLDDLRRVEAWAGEARVNLIRLVAIVAFYGHHLLNVFVFSGDQALRGRFHAVVTLVVVAWGATVGILYYFLSRRKVPPLCMYVSTIWDAALITALLALTGDGPRSPLVVLFLLVIAAAPLRFSLPLVWVATAASLAGYLFLLAYYVFVLVGYDAYYATAGQAIPRSHQIIFVLLLLTAGLLAGQLVRQVRRLVDGQAVAFEEPRP
jgi:hypothetical protein